MRRRLMVGVLWLFGRLPRSVRRRIVRVVAPKYTLGVLCIVQRADGSVLLVRHSYGRRWGTVGGLAARGEEPAVCALREAREEVGLELVLVGEPAVVVVPEFHRLDVVYLARPAHEAAADRVEPRSAEIIETRWFGRDELPELSADTASAWNALARLGVVEPPGIQPIQTPEP